MDNINRDSLFKEIQTYLTETPVVLAGTGVSIPAGIPGMNELSTFLQNEFKEKYKENTNWQKITNRLDEGIDLESALTGVDVKGELLNDIVNLTWKLVSDSDIKFFYENVISRTRQPLCDLLEKLMSTCYNSVNIITTNYDRYIEYCCDISGVKIDNCFDGFYLKTLSNRDLKKKNVVNLLKVHGSLDTFHSIDTNESICIPLQYEIPMDFIPEIVTPGSDKYETLLTTDTYRNILYKSDEIINNAKCYLCIGYGFNDSQIQQNILRNITYGKPIVIVTKKLSDFALSLINNKAQKYVVLIEGQQGKTRVIINKKDYEIDGEYWKLENFLDII